MPAKRTRKEPPLFKNKQWQECYESWLRAAHAHSGSEDTTINYRTVTHRFFSDPLRTPDRYTRAEVEAFIHAPARHKGGVTSTPKAATQNGRLEPLRSFYAYAAEYDVPFRTGVRPLLHTRAPTHALRAVKVGRPRRSLTVEELHRLFDAVPREDVLGKRDYALFCCYFYTARRRTEIIRLRWGDIYECVFLEKGVPRVGHMYRYTSKGKSREVHTAELPPEAWEPLVDYLKASGRYEHLTAESPLFVRHDHGRLSWMEEQPLNKNSLAAILAKYRDAAGLSGTGKQVCIHSFRHTRAGIQYRMVEQDVMAIKRLLGHESLETTMLYLADDEEPDRGAAGVAAKIGKL